MGTIHIWNLEHNDLPEDKYLQEQLEGFNITGILDLRRRNKNFN